MPDSLAVSYFGTTMVVRPTAAQGLGLLCTGPIRQVMVMEYQAQDREAFWRAWRSLGGESQCLAWEDGSPFISPLGHDGSLGPVEYGTPRHSAASGGWLRRAAAMTGISLYRAAAASWRWCSRLWELPAEDSP